MRRLTIIIFFIGFAVVNCLAQQGSGEKGFKMVKLPDTVRNKLAQYLSQQEKLETPNRAIYVFNLMNPKDYEFKKGIYSFKLMGPHFQRRIFIYTNNEIIIFNGYFIDDLLEEFTKFCNIVQIPVKEKILYLKAIADFLQTEYNTENN